MTWFQRRCARWLLVALIGLTGCAHATQTRSQEPRGGGAGENEKPQPAAGAAKKPDAAPQPNSPQRAEAITTSKTTNEMFKEEGLKKLQHALAQKTQGLEETGKLDSKTQEALRAFQKEQKLPDTGLPDFETIRRLGAKPEEVYQHSPPSQRVGVQ